ncbi:MAG: MBL fold metallo-hydrolase, partial [Ilumatobacter sp.]
MNVITIETASLGDRSYVVHDGEVALVVDPQRDIDRVLAAAHAARVTITHVAETHVHNDYVSGGLTLARVTGATYLHAAAEPLRFDYHAVSDGDAVTVGSMRVEVRHTPGHTPHHLSYVVTADGAAPAAFTGGSLLYGTVGRTDLIGPESTDELTHAQYRSVHALADSLPDQTLVYPTHGFGSFCASAASEEESDGTLGTERTANIALTAPD